MDETNRDVLISQVSLVAIRAKYKLQFTLEDFEVSRRLHNCLKKELKARKGPEILTPEVVHNDRLRATIQESINKNHRNRTPQFPHADDTQLMEVAEILGVILEEEDISTDEARKLQKLLWFLGFFEIPPGIKEHLTNNNEI